MNSEAEVGEAEERARLRGIDHRAAFFARWQSYCKRCHAPIGLAHYPFIFYDGLCHDCFENERERKASYG